MLIPEDLTVRELKVECSRHTNCETCKYKDSCVGTYPSQFEVASKYPEFREQEIEILRFYNECGYKKVYFNEYDSAIEIESPRENHVILPVFLMLTVAKHYDSNNPLNIQQYLDWYNSNN